MCGSICAVASGNSHCHHLSAIRIITTHDTMNTNDEQAKYEAKEPKNTGGPAFPSLKTTWNKSPGVYSSEVEPGMTLRDYFAAKAMPMLMKQWPIDIFDNHAQDEVAQRCYLMADAMLKAREQ